MGRPSWTVLTGVSLLLLFMASPSSDGDPLQLGYERSPLESTPNPRPRPFLGLSRHSPNPYSGLEPPRISLRANTKLRSAVSVSMLSAGLYVALDKKSRNWVKTKWEFTFSPNHAQAANKGPFRFRTHQEELSQVSHIDKWCHFVFAYLPFEPLTIYSQRFLDGLPGWLGGTDNTSGISGKAVFLSAVIVTSGSVLEEYLDGFQKDEGFSVHDLLCNFGGVTLGVLKHKGYFKNLMVHWRFTGTPKGWRYPWFDYMPGYAARVSYDLSDLVFRRKEREEPAAAKFVRVVGYLPSHREEDREFYLWTAPIW